MFFILILKRLKNNKYEKLSKLIHKTEDKNIDKEEKFKILLESKWTQKTETQV